MLTVEWRASWLTYGGSVASLESPLRYNLPGLWDQGVSAHFRDTRESPFILTN